MRSLGLIVLVVVGLGCKSKPDDPPAATSLAPSTPAAQANKPAQPAPADDARVAATDDAVAAKPKKLTQQQLDKLLPLKPVKRPGEPRR